MVGVLGGLCSSLRVHSFSVFLQPALTWTLNARDHLHQAPRPAGFRSGSANKRHQLGIGVGKGRVTGGISTPASAAGRLQVSSERVPSLQTTVHARWSFPMSSMVLNSGKGSLFPRLQGSGCFNNLIGFSKPSQNFAHDFHHYAFPWLPFSGHGPHREGELLEPSHSNTGRKYNREHWRMSRFVHERKAELEFGHVGFEALPEPSQGSENQGPEPSEGDWADGHRWQCKGSHGMV